MSDTEAPPTNPNPTPPPESYDDEQARESIDQRFARINLHQVRNSLAPVEGAVADLSSKFDTVLTIAHQIFDEFQGFKHEIKQRIEQLERRVTKTELEIAEIKDRLGG